MPNVFGEAHPKGPPEGSPRNDSVLEDCADHVFATFKMQNDAIDWATKNGHSALVARVLDLNDKKTPDHWRGGLTTSISVVLLTASPAKRQHFYGLHPGAEPLAFSNRSFKGDLKDGFFVARFVGWRTDYS